MTPEPKTHSGRLMLAYSGPAYLPTILAIEAEAAKLEHESGRQILSEALRGAEQEIEGLRAALKQAVADHGDGWYRGALLRPHEVVGNEQQPDVLEPSESGA